MKHSSRRPTSDRPGQRPTSCVTGRHARRSAPYTRSSTSCAVRRLPMQPMWSPTCKATPTDVVACDFMLLGAFVGAEACHIPSVGLVHTVAVIPLDGLPPIPLRPTAGARPSGALERQAPASAARDRVLRRWLRCTERRACPLPARSPLDCLRAMVPRAAAADPVESHLRLPREPSPRERPLRRAPFLGSARRHPTGPARALAGPARPGVAQHHLPGRRALPAGTDRGARQPPRPGRRDDRRRI